MRIVRALEVYEITGKTLSDSIKEQPASPLLNLAAFGLKMERAHLVKRIEERVDTMLANGLIEEVKGLLEAGYRESLKNLPTIGYREIISFIDGEFDEKTMIDKIKRNSRKYAKRQMTWFRSDDRIRWIDVEIVEDPANIILTEWRNRK